MRRLTKNIVCIYVNWRKCYKIIARQNTRCEKEVHKKLCYKEKRLNGEQYHVKKKGSQTKRYVEQTAEETHTLRVNSLSKGGIKSAIQILIHRNHIYDKDQAIHASRADADGRHHRKLHIVTLYSGAV